MVLVGNDVEVFKVLIMIVQVFNFTRVLLVCKRFDSNHFIIARGCNHKARLAIGLVLRAHFCVSRVITYFRWEHVNRFNVEDFCLCHPFCVGLFQEI